MKYDDHAKVLECLKRDQEAEEDLRQEIDEIIDFIHHPQGQWEPDIWNDFDGRPRYTFDQQKPAINRAWAEMAANEYAAQTQPIGDGATEDLSNIIDGLLRAIYDHSSFDDVSTRAGKRMIGTGFSGWRIVSTYLGESFYQDLVIEPIPDFHRRVWFDCNSEKQTREDAMHVFILAEVQQDEKKWKRALESISTNRSSHSYSYKPSEMATVGEILYKKPYRKTLYLIDDEFSTVTDDEGLERMRESGQNPIVLDQRDNVTCYRVYSRKFDNKDWLGDEEETAFSYLPVIPEYANFDITEGKVTYEGLVRARMDAQRVFNYVESRKVEESVLSPRRKIFMDSRAAQGYTDELSNLNRNPAAVQLFNGAGADEAKHGQVFFPIGGAEPNGALTEISNDMIRNLSLTSNLPSQMEELQAAGRDSDFRAENRYSMGQIGTYEYYRGHKIALEYTTKVLIDAIPKVYDTDRKIRTVDEAGQSSEVRINQNMNGQILNNLTVGKYTVNVKIGKQFESRKSEANDGIFRMGEIVPSVVDTNADIIAHNIDAPGMQQVADRERYRLIQQRKIPESQWTDEERERAAMAAQNQQPDPAALIAQAEMEKARAETDKVQTQLLIEQAKLEQKQIELEISGSKAANETQLKAIEMQMKAQAQEIENLKNVALAFKALAEAGATENMSKQAQVTTKAQNEVMND